MIAGVIFKTVRLKRQDLAKFAEKYKGTGMQGLSHLVVSFDRDAKVIDFSYRGRIRPVNSFALSVLFHECFYGRIGTRIDLSERPRIRRVK